MVSVSSTLQDTFQNTPSLVEGVLWLWLWDKAALIVFFLGNGLPGFRRRIWAECTHSDFGSIHQTQTLWKLGDMGFKLQPSICKATIGRYGYPERSLVRTVDVAMSKSLIFFYLDPIWTMKNWKRCSRRLNWRLASHSPFVLESWDLIFGPNGCFHLVFFKKSNRAPILWPSTTILKVWERINVIYWDLFKGGEKSCHIQKYVTYHD